MIEGQPQIGLLKQQASPSATPFEPDLAPAFYAYLSQPANCLRNERPHPSGRCPRLLVHGLHESYPYRGTTPCVHPLSRSPARSCSASPPTSSPPPPAPTSCSSSPTTTPSRPSAPM